MNRTGLGRLRLRRCSRRSSGADASVEAGSASFAPAVPALPHHLSDGREIAIRSWWSHAPQRPPHLKTLNSDPRGRIAGFLRQHRYNPRRPQVRSPSGIEDFGSFEPPLWGGWLGHHFGSTIVFEDPSGAACIEGGVCPCGLSAGAPPEPVSSGDERPSVAPFSPSIVGGRTVRPVLSGESVAAFGSDCACGWVCADAVPTHIIRQIVAIAMRMAVPLLWWNNNNQDLLSFP